MSRTYTIRTLLETYKWAKAHPHGIIPIDWATQLTGTEWLRWFRQCLDAKISSTMPQVGRKWDDLWQIEAQRTARAVNSRQVVRYVPADFCERLRHRLWQE